MEQLAFKFSSDEIEVFSKKGAMYAYAPGTPYEIVPIELGDQVLHPGQFVTELGEKKRSGFSMQDGYALRYVGKSGDYLLFGVNDQQVDYYYAFAYVSKNILLLLGGNGAASDIRIERLEVFNDFPRQAS